jgi:hypothetical protein
MSVSRLGKCRYSVPGPTRAVFAIEFSEASGKWQGPRGPPRECAPGCVVRQPGGTRAVVRPWEQTLSFQPVPTWEPEISPIGADGCRRILRLRESNLRLNGMVSLGAEAGRAWANRSSEGREFRLAAGRCRCRGAAGADLILARPRRTRTVVAAAYRGARTAAEHHVRPAAGRYLPP